METKMCSKCKKEFHLNSSNFQEQKNRKQKFKSYCRNCGKEMCKNYRVKNKEKCNDNAITFKKCSTCKKVLLVSEFSVCKSWKDGLSYQCNECKNKTWKKYYDENSEELNGKTKIRNDKNYQHNLEKYRNYRHEWYVSNKDKRKSYMSDYIKARMKTDIEFKLVFNLRRRLRSAVIGQKTTKANHTMDLIGCSSDFLKKHLESKFRDGMSWKNYGKKHNELRGWEIDHILPCSSFNLIDEIEQYKCFHWTNLQPLWREENISKSARINGDDKLC